MKLHGILGIGDFGVNCYIVETDQKNALIIDAPWDAELISREIDRLGLSLKMILLTHGHVDHTEALGGLVEKYACEVYIHKGDADALTSSYLSFADYLGVGFTPFYGAKTLSDGDTITLDGEALRVIHTPGHSAGSVCYMHDDCIFTGDTLFNLSVGRTDNPNGDFEQEIRSIGKLFREAGRNYVIYPGHGEASDLEFEMKYNPFLEALRTGK